MKALVSRKLYTQIMRLYPEPFRAEFSEEMLSMFDECEPALGSRHLLQDVLISVARQRIITWSCPNPQQSTFIARPHLPRNWLLSSPFLSFLWEQ